jgi:ribosomal protein L16 Arg81 hydroxylase
MPVNFADLLAPHTIDEFFSRYSGRRPLYVPGANGRFTDVLSWQGLNDMLNHCRLLPPRVRLVKDGAPVPDEQYVAARGSQERILAAPSVSRHLREGATLIINGVDELCSSVLGLAERLESTLRVRVQVNAYLALGDTRGSRAHWDNHDVFVMQVVGRKAWRIYDSPARWPVDLFGADDGDPPEGPPYWEGTVEDGDVLYVPRGWWHAAVPCGEPTLHLTIGVTYPTSLGLLRWLVDELKGDEWMRRDLPVFDASGDTASSYVRTLSAKVAAACQDPSLIERYLGWTSGATPARGAAGLPWSAGETALPEDARSVIHLTTPFARVVGTEGVSAISFGHQMMTLGAEDARLVRMLLDSAPISITDFCDRVDGVTTLEDARQLIEALAQCGFVYFTGPALTARTSLVQME